MSKLWACYWFVIAFVMSGALLCGGVMVGRTVGLQAHTGARTCVASAWVFDARTGEEVPVDVLKNTVLVLGWDSS